MPARRYDENERVKRRYLHFLREAKRQSEASVDKAAAAIVRFEASTGYVPFESFTTEQAFGPHSVRRTLAQHGERVCGTPEEFKAWSQNLGHDDVLTTFNSYGVLQDRRQAALIRGLAKAA